MNVARRHRNEQPHRQALHPPGVLDTLPVPGLDRITRTAIRLFGVSAAMVLLTEHDGRLWLKSHAGLSAAEVPRYVDFCARAFHDEEALTVCDTGRDPRFRDHPLVASPPHIHFFASHPIHSANGRTVGVLWLGDTHPHHLDDADRTALMDLASLAGQCAPSKDTASQVNHDPIPGGDLFARIVAEASVGIAVVSPDGRWLEVNQPLCALAGRPREKLLGTLVRDILHPNDANAVITRTRQALAGENGLSGEQVRFMRGDGSAAWAQVGVSALHDSDGQSRNLIVVVTDIQARKQAEDELSALQKELEQRIEARTRDLDAAVAQLKAETIRLETAQHALKEEKEHFLHTLKTTADAFVETDAEGRIQIWNDAAEHIFGLARPEAIGRRLIDTITPPSLRDTYQHQFRRMTASSQRKTGRRLEIQGMRSDGSSFPMEVTIGTLSMGGRTRFNAFLRDITEEQRLRERLQHEALHDPLTGLPNRRALLERIEQNMSRAKRNHHPMGLLFLDLDGFKTINDTLGHDFGDAVLQAFARVIRSTVRETDFVARIAGDEFVVVLESLQRAHEDIGYVAWKLLERIKTVTEVQGVVMALSSSIGAAVHLAADEETAQELVTRADAAMYRAKAMGRHRFSL